MAQTLQNQQHLPYYLEQGPIDPHSILGLHPHPDDSQRSLITLWRPGATSLFIEVGGKTVQMEPIERDGLFQLEQPLPVNEVHYKIYHTSGLCSQDPYTFLPTISDLERHLFNKGCHYRLWQTLGAHPMTHQGISGVRFAVWAPNAQRVALVADFNHWDGRVNPMRLLGSSGIWELFVPGLSVGEKYKFEIRSSQGQICLKADPFAFHSELRPATASIVSSLEFEWFDQNWMAQRGPKQSYNDPILIYEVHLGSWRQNNGSFLNYREIAIELANYCLEMGFTHVELLPIMEHPLDESWGYQVSGYYSVTSRFGTVADFQWFVNHMHLNGIAVLLDWVPAHFPTDEFSLARFDGTALYEHSDNRQGFHPHWGTFIFNLGRHEVSNFLIANALFWLQVMHVDGLRVDAVASMLYLDYGREEGQWIANAYGGRENLEAIEFFKHINSIVHHYCPTALMIAEESTSFTGVTHSVDKGGLGFDLKWNMGWMNDTLQFISTDTLYRGYHQHQLTFGLLYAYSERFALVLSHDEVVHGKKSLLSKMPGDRWQQFANLRLLYSYLMCQPGKKLIFMGAELGSWDEWNCKKELCWQLLNFPEHRALQLMVKELNHLYLNKNALWREDGSWKGYSWVDFSDSYNSVLCYLRHGIGQHLLCVHNFTPNCHKTYHLPLQRAAQVREIFNSDNERYGGAGNLTGAVNITHHGIEITLAPLATMIFEVKFIEKR